MNISVAGQTFEFLYAALLGVGLGVTYDIIRLIRSYIKPNKIITALFDILFWICAIVALLGFVLTVSGGRMRWYVLVGTFCGSFVYMCTISALFFRSIRIIIAVIVKLLGLSVRPLYLLQDWLLKTARNTKRKMESRPKKQKKPKPAIPKKKKRKKKKQEVS